MHSKEQTHRSEWNNEVNPKYENRIQQGDKIAEEKKKKQTKMMLEIKNSVKAN